jgi:NADH-quinone oxidoreductase subunit M
VIYGRSSGRVQAFPRLAAAFALFGAASVAMPGTVGFVADDLLLHTLWMESPGGTVVMILASAMLAVSTLICYAHVFLGKPAPLLAPDLVPRERVVAVALAALLVVLGFAPGLLLYPADAFLEIVPAIAAP